MGLQFNPFSDEQLTFREQTIMNQSENRMKRMMDWLFRTADGTIVIAQFPNWPLWTWLGATVLQLIDLLYAWHGLIGWIGTAALTWWAYLEITGGVNGFRKVLGSLVMMYIVLSRTHMI